MFVKPAGNAYGAEKGRTRGDLLMGPLGKAGQPNHKHTSQTLSRTHVPP